MPKYGHQQQQQLYRSLATISDLTTNVTAAWWMATTRRSCMGAPTRQAKDVHRIDKRSGHDWAGDGLITFLQ